jgi:hypothetical protein
MSDMASHPVARALDVLAAGSIIGSIMGYLPAIASILSIVWFCIQIYESRTFTHAKNNWLMRRKAKKIAKLKAKEKVLAAQIEAIETVRSAKVVAREKVVTAKAEAALDVIHGTTEATIDHLMEPTQENSKEIKE